MTIQKTNESAPSLIWAKGKRTGFYYKIEEGTGDNLLQEDIDEGYVDYICYDYYASLSDLQEENTYDGGFYYLKKLYQNMTLKEVLACIEEMEEELEVLEVHG